MIEKDTNNLSIANLRPEIKSQLVKQSYAKRRPMCDLIDKNIGEPATITVRPKNPLKQLTTLHESHKIMVNSGWIQSVVLGHDEKLLKPELKADKNTRKIKR